MRKEKTIIVRIIIIKLEINDMNVLNLSIFWMIMVKFLFNIWIYNIHLIVFPCLTTLKCSTSGTYLFMLWKVVFGANFLFFGLSCV